MVQGAGPVRIRRRSPWLRLGFILLVAALAYVGVDALLGGLDLGTWIAAGAIGAGGLALLVMGLRAEAMRRRLLRDGLPAEATIVGIRSRGALNGEPFLSLDLEVQPPYGAAYRVRRREAVPMMVAPRLTLGQRLPIRVDPDRQDRILLDWEEVLHSAAGPSDRDSP